MASKTDLLRERYEQFSRGDIEGALSNWTDDFTWEGGNSEDMPGGGTHQGKDQAVQVLQQAVGAWDEFKLTADEFYENGDTVVVLGHTDVKKGDESAQLPVVHIWRFRGDEEVCRLQILTDTLQGARMLGKA
jgi:ketosteroid isomerase-like protein